MFSSKFGLTTKIIKGERILQELWGIDPVLETQHCVIRWIIDLRDQQVREALMKLGWTPPPDLQESERPENPPLEDIEIG